MFEIAITKKSAVSGEARENYPPLDMYEQDEQLCLVFELPGVKVDDLLLKIYQNMLIIEGVKVESAPEGGRFICVERQFGGFRRNIKLPCKVDPEGVTAVYRDGILYVRFPIVEERVYKIKIIKER